MCIELIDDHKANLFKCLSEGINFITEGLEQHSKASHSNIFQSNKGGCLVASTKGVSRSAAFVIGYLIYARQMTLSSAMTFVRLKRKIAHPNSNF
jgi:protein-tyrosine phosphatase